MKILSFDVSGNYSSISFLNNEEVNTFTQTHDRKDRPDWDKLFESIGFDSDEGFDAINGIAFACGPGSYTALRITASFLKAIAEIKKLPLVPISNLESIAKEASYWINENKAKIFVTIEADANESYFCSYEKLNDEVLAIEEESVINMDHLLKILDEEGCYFAGSGWPDPIEKHPNFLSQAIGSAESVAIVAKKKLETNKDFLPEDANPVYLKTPEYKKS
jgi:tRNA threonylcarbamoyladenosine biosynthesis protein TsaB